MFTLNTASTDQKIREQSIYKIAKLYVKLGYVITTPLQQTFHLMFIDIYRQTSELGALMKKIRPFFDTVAKATTANIGMAPIQYITQAV